jgi:hypothetical protein
MDKLFTPLFVSKAEDEIRYQKIPSIVCSECLEALKIEGWEFNV